MALVSGLPVAVALSSPTSFRRVELRSFRGSLPSRYVGRINSRCGRITANKLIDSAHPEALNELPQLANILKGDMSVVGPRPAMMVEQELLRLRDENGSNVLRPGLTGWAQVNGRDSLNVQEKAAFDGSYLQRLSLALDLKCILMTFSRVATAEGVAEEGKGDVSAVASETLVEDMDQGDCA